MILENFANNINKEINWIALFNLVVFLDLIPKICFHTPGTSWRIHTILKDVKTELLRNFSHYTMYTL